MSPSQIVIRSMLIGELRQHQYTGIMHGKYRIATADEVQAEINRRAENTACYYLRQIY